MNRLSLRITGAQNINLNKIQHVKEKETDNEFSFELNRVGSDDLNERVNGLVKDITAQGKIIADKADIRDMKKYRSLIGEFINEVVTHSHKFSRENFLDRRGRLRGIAGGCTRARVPGRRDSPRPRPSRPWRWLVAGSPIPHCWVPRLRSGRRV